MVLIYKTLTPMDCSPPGSSVHGILQARILEWVAISYSRGSSRARDLLYWQVDSLPSSHLGSPIKYRSHSYSGHLLVNACAVGSVQGAFPSLSGLGHICPAGGSASRAHWAAVVPSAQLWPIWSWHPVGFYNPTPLLILSGWVPFPYFHYVFLNVCMLCVCVPSYLPTHITFTHRYAHTYSVCFTLEGEFQCLLLLPAMSWIPICIYCLVL